jgi:hypothetical protein
MDLSQQVGFGGVVEAALEMELEQHSNLPHVFRPVRGECWCSSA